jgi:hypothetical protein
MVEPPRFDCGLAQTTLPKSSSLLNPRSIPALMLAQPVSLCFIIAAVAGRIAQSGLFAFGPDGGRR